jgi:CBS domain-containing protein
MIPNESNGMTLQSPSYASAFDSTLHKLNAAFSVWDIATVEPVTIRAETSLNDFIAGTGAPEFDFYPVVSEDGEIIGVVERHASDCSKRASESMRSLDNSILVSSGANLVSALKKLDSNSVLLILHETKIAGILTKADAQKLPVRLYAFTVITHLESLMASIIQTYSGSSDEWISLLSPGRQSKVRDKSSFLKSKNLDPPLVECCDFCDKHKVVRKLLSLKNDFTINMEAIEDLRNSIAHSAAFIKSDADLHSFIVKLDTIQNWIHILAGFESARHHRRQEIQLQNEGNTQ